MTGALISAEWDRYESYVFGETFTFTSGSKSIIEKTSLDVTRKAESLM